MMASSKRLRREMVNLVSNPDSQISLRPREDNIKEWKAFIKGPPDSPFEGGVFELRISVGQEYPMSPPTVAFVTKIFHPNVHFKTGEICLDVLKKAWSPAWSLQAACRAIIALLGEPAADSPLNCDAGNMIRAGDLRAYRSMATMYRIEYGSGPMPADEIM